MPRYTTACTAGCSAISRITSGIVSRVSPPAQSTGLLRLQRGGSSSSMASRRSSGRASRRRSPSRAMASAVTTPQPPAVVSTTTFGPAGAGCVANVAAASNASSTVAALVIPAARHSPVEHLVVGGQRAGVARRGAGPALGRPALDEHERLARGGAGEAVEQRPAVGDALDVGQPDGGRRVVGVVVEVVGDRHGGGVAGRHRTADPDAGRPGEFMKLDTKLPLWLATPMRPAGGYGATIWAHSADRRADDALAVRAGEQDPELVGEGDELGLGPLALLARLAVAGRRQERRLDALRRARPQQPGVGRRRRAHEDEVDLAVGQLGDVGDGADAEHLLALQVGAEHPALVAGGEEVVQGHEAELAGVRGGAGDEHAAGLEQGAELLGGRCRAGGRRRLRHARRRPRRARRRRPAEPSGVDDQRVDVDADDVGALGGDAAEGDERRGEGVAVDRRLAAELVEQALRGELVDHLVGGDRVDRGRSEDDVGDRLGQDAADAEHDGRTELRVAHDPGDQLAVAADHRGDQHGDVAVVGRGRGEQLAGGAAHGVGVAEAEADEPALGLVGDRVTVELGDDRIAQRVGGGDGLVGARRQRSRARSAPRSRRAGAWTRSRRGCGVAIGAGG